jgi:hypothetical protein
VVQLDRAVQVTVELLSQLLRRRPRRVSVPMDFGTFLATGPVSSSFAPFVPGSSKLPITPHVAGCPPGKRPKNMQLFHRPHRPHRPAQPPCPGRHGKFRRPKSASGPAPARPWAQADAADAKEQGFSWSGIIMLASEKGLFHRAPARPVREDGHPEAENSAEEGQTWTGTSSDGPFL